MLTFFSGVRTRKLAAIAAIYGYDAPNSAPSGRDAMVQSLGN